MKRHFGTGRDSVSSLDWDYRPRSSIVRRLPEVADLRRHCPPVYGHAKRLVTFRNSWGAAWGDGGYGYLPYAFFTSPRLTWDFWTMRRVS